MRNCRLEPLFLFISLLLGLLVACGGESKTAGGVTEDEGIVAVVDKTIAGVSQKGPYVKGSLVSLYELDGTLEPTGKVFTGEISSHKGEFSLSNINLKSQFVHLVSKGYYRNEVSGKTSVGEITLNAISDIQDRKTVNINLLTHLEYRRILALIENGTFLSKAKKQAESDIFKAFYIDIESADNFEDLNIFESTEEDAALLAISILLQRELSEGDLTAELKEISDDIAETGKWNDKNVQAEVADWAVDADLETIRTNIENWNFGSVPKFESHVKRFWWQNFGLGDCDATREGDSSGVTNKLSVNFEKVFVCESGDWVRVKPTLRGTGFEPWTYTDGNSIKSSLGKGVWLINTDSFNGGTTTVTFGKKDLWTFDVPEVVTIDNKSIQDCEGVCGTIHFADDDAVPGSVYAVLSAVAGKPGDATAWLGFCVEYQSSMQIFANLSLENSFSASYDYDDPGYYLPASDKKSVANVLWDSLSQRGYSGVKVQVSEVMDIVTGLKLSFFGSVGDSATFNITKVGAYGTCE